MEELEKLQAQCNEYLSGWKRAKADLINFQKQIDRERADWRHFVTAECVRKFLPVVDALEAAAAHESGIKNHESGVEQVRNQMQGILRELEVEEIKTVGEPIDPALHEVVGTEKSDKHAPSIIVEEVQKGYKMHGKVLRAAKVIVEE